MTGPWTVVNRKKGNTVARIMVEDKLGPNPNPKYCVQELKDIRGKVVSIWKDQDVRANWHEMVRKQMTQSPKRISNAVCMGLGTVETLEPGVRTGFCVFTQLEIFLEMVAILEEFQQQSINIYFQEPQFSQAEKTHLQELGYTILADPQAFSVINDKTFLYAPHLPWIPYIDCINAGPPAIVLGNPLDMIGDGPWVGNPEDIATRDGAIKVAIEFGKTCHKMTVPNYQHILDGDLYWNIAEQVDEKEACETGAETS